MGGAASIATFVEDTINEKCNQIIGTENIQPKKMVYIVSNNTMSTSNLIVSNKKDSIVSNISQKSSKAVNLFKRNSQTIESIGSTKEKLSQSSKETKDSKDNKDNKDPTLSVNTIFTPNSNSNSNSNATVLLDLFRKDSGLKILPPLNTQLSTLNSQSSTQLPSNLSPAPTMMSLGMGLGSYGSDIHSLDKNSIIQNNIEQSSTAQNSITQNSIAQNSIAQNSIPFQLSPSSLSNKRGSALLEPIAKDTKSSRISITTVEPNHLISSKYDVVPIPSIATSAAISPMGAGASDSIVNTGNNTTVGTARVVGTATTSPTQRDAGMNSSSGKIMKSVKSIRQMALFNYSRQENTYIPQDQISLQFDSKQALETNEILSSLPLSIKTSARTVPSNTIQSNAIHSNTIQSSQSNTATVNQNSSQAAAALAAITIATKANGIQQQQQQQQQPANRRLSLTIKKQLSTVKDSDVGTYDSESDRDTKRDDSSIKQSQKQSQKKQSQKQGQKHRKVDSDSDSDSDNDGLVMITQSNIVKNDIIYPKPIDAILILTSEHSMPNVPISKSEEKSEDKTSPVIKPSAAETPNTSPVKGIMRKPTLAISIQDDQDWIQVSESDDDEPTGDEKDGANNTADNTKVVTPKMNQRASLSVNFPQQSYLFTQSGTIFVDGFMEGIRKDGIVTLTQPQIRPPSSNLPYTSPDKSSIQSPLLKPSPGNSLGGSLGGSMLSPDGKAFLGACASTDTLESLAPRIPVNERLVIICKLGQGASSVVYKALDLVSMRLVALKMIPVFERGKRRQMVRELGAMFQMLRKKQEDFANGHKKFSELLDGIFDMDDIDRDEDSPTSQGGYILDSLPNINVTSNSNSIHNFTTNNPMSNTTYMNNNNVSTKKKTPGDFIVDFYDAFSNIEEGRVALMMEYMDGGSLQDIVDHGGCDDEATLATIAKQALFGLAFLHSCSQLHRDLKPANFLISHNGDVKIADLGIMKQLGDETQEHVSNIPTIGNPHARSRSNSVSISYANYLSQIQQREQNLSSPTANQSENSSPFSHSPKKMSVNNIPPIGNGIPSIKKPGGIADANTMSNIVEDDLGIFSPAGKGYERKEKEGEVPFQNPLLLSLSPVPSGPPTLPGSLIPGTLPPRKKSVSIGYNNGNKRGSIGIGDMLGSPLRLNGLGNDGLNSPRLPRTHTFVGTATYMSPERIDGKEYSFPSDVWGLGLSLMTVAMGKLPFDVSGGYWSLLTSIRDEPLITLLPNTFSDDFRDFLSRCLHRNPDRRYTTFQLLKHPFLAKAMTSNNTGYNSSSASPSVPSLAAGVGVRSRTSSVIDGPDGMSDRERGLKEFKAILQAVYLHIERLQSQLITKTNSVVSSMNASMISNLNLSLNSQSTDTNNQNINHLPPGTTVEDDLHSKLFFGDLKTTPPEKIVQRLLFGLHTDNTDPMLSRYQHRLNNLIEQLGLSQDDVTREANQFITQISLTPRPIGSIVESSTSIIPLI